MYEVIKVVKGYEITRLIGSRRFYHVAVGGGREYCFHTIKAAVEFINSSL